MSKKDRKDPHYERELEKYADPIPSRHFILSLMEEVGRPVSFRQLVKQLELKEESKQEALGFRIKAMLRDGQIMQDRRDRFCLLNKINLIKGSVQGHPEGFGFFIPDDDGEDMFLAAREMRAVMHGDKVMAYRSGTDRRGRAEAKIHEVIERAHETVVGRFISDHGVFYVQPDSKRLTQDIFVPPECRYEAKDGQIVLVEIIAFPNKRTQAVGQVIHILGDHMAPGMEIQVALHAHSIPHVWPEAVAAEVAKIPQSVDSASIVSRKDLRDLDFVTIDGEDARDFDDAVYAYKKPKGGYQLFVAIADVSHYVKAGSKLDQEAARRGNSTYFPGEVIPMLPEALSNGICSLNPLVDRLCMVAEMSISEEGKVTRSRFYRAVIHSKARLTYNLVAGWLEQSQADEQHSAFWPTISNLYQVYQRLAETRKKRGAMDFESLETKILFDEQKKIKKIVPQERNDAHKMIEECMLAANVATAHFLEKAKIPSLYRVHELPDEDKIAQLKDFLGGLGLKLGGGTKPRTADFQQVLKDAVSRPDKHLIETVVLRSMSQARYVEVNEGHFGLAYPAYTHFTSPIRRYPDLLIHRAIGHLLDSQTTNNFQYTHKDMSQMGKHCSMTERRSDEATREVVSWLKCEYMQDKLGQVFQGHISAVTGFGVFVALDEIYVEGLVHVTSLKSDYYQFDAAKHQLLGTRSGKAYRLGDPMTVLLARVDLDERKIDFEPAEEEAADE